MSQDSYWSWWRQWDEWDDDWEAGLLLVPWLRHGMPRPRAVGRDLVLAPTRVSGEGLVS